MRSRAAPFVGPAVTAALLASGGIVWAVGRAGVLANGARTADAIWFFGLIVTGAPVVWQTVRGIAKGHFASDIIATLSVLTAVALHEPVAGLVIVLMQTGGEALEQYAEGRASAAVRELEAAAPRIAHRLMGGSLTDVPVDAIAVGDVLLLRPGELVPCDAVVLDGRSMVDASRITGEPVPVDASTGTRLLSGSANGDGPLTIRAAAVARESQYARIVELVRSAQSSKAPLQRLADRYAVWFTPATLVMCAGAWLVTRDPQRILAVLVVATPCPLILATPIAIIGGINRAARRGIVVRHGGALEQLGSTSVVVFDKTGTLTIGRPEVSRVITADGWRETDLLRIAGAVEQGAGHLLARTLVAAAERAAAGEGGVLPSASQVVETAGRGVTGVVGAHRVSVGARAYVAELYPDGAGALRCVDASFGDGAGLRAYIAVDGTPVGAVEYEDRVRDDAALVVSELRQLGVGRAMMLSGDHATNVRAVAAAIGVADGEARADLLPEDKVRVVRALVDAGERVTMVGDGTNDAPALSAATVGIALAAHGGGVTAESADIVVLTDDLRRVPEAIRISRRTVRVARQSLTVGLGLSGAAMIVAAAGHIQPIAGALLQEVIDVAVILNALRASRSNAGA